jgi:hypothetical protein
MRDEGRARSRNRKSESKEGNEHERKVSEHGLQFVRRKRGDANVSVLGLKLETPGAGLGEIGQKHEAF